MSSLIETITVPETTVPTHLRYLGTIQDQPLVWDDRQHQAIWPEDEPERAIYHPNGSITKEPIYDVYQAWWRGVKPLDCGHGISAPGIYLTALATNEDICLACAGGRS